MSVSLYSYELFAFTKEHSIPSRAAAVIGMTESFWAVLSEGNGAGGRFILLLESLREREREREKERKRERKRERERMLSPVQFQKTMVS